MAEPEPSGGSDSFGFLTHKVGPLQVWMWALIAVGAYYWYTHYGPGSSSTATAPVATSADSGDSTPQPFYTGSQFKNNAQWEAAAVSYLTAESVPPTEASTALYNYLHGKPLNSQQQRDVNLAVEGIGPPPSIPPPAPGSAPQPHKHPKPGHPHVNPGGPVKLTKAQQTLTRRAGEGSDIHHGMLSRPVYNRSFKPTGTPRSWVIKRSERQHG